MNDKKNDHQGIPGRRHPSGRHARRLPLLKGALLIPALLMLAACDNTTPVDTVRSLTLPARGDMTLGELLDGRPVCDKTEWFLIDGGGKAPKQVEYHCTFSAVESQGLFNAQLTTWVERNKRRISNGEKGRTDALDERMRATQALARQVFEQVQANGELDRYKAIVKDSPVDNMSLEAVKVFYSSPDSDDDIAGRLAGNEMARETVAAVYHAVTAAGLATTTPQGDACQAPASLMLAVTSSSQETEQAFADCLSGVDLRYQSRLAEAEKAVSAARARLDKVGGNVTLTRFSEIVRWDLVEKQAPVVTYHGLEMVTQAGDLTRRFTRSLGTDEETLLFVYDGKFNDYYHNMFISTMSDLVRQ